jgi:enoyl-CoA hydratase/carnithine racemase
MSDEAVLTSLENGIATMTLNRPEKLNALSDDVKTGIRDALDAFEGRDDVRCLLIEGAGRAFCAGGDVSSQNERLDDAPPAYQRSQRIVRDCENIPMRIHEYEVPTIAKIDGHCVGAGMGLAFSCDVHLASSEAKFGLVFRNVGLTLDFATSYLLPRLIGTNTAKELALTGEIITAGRAEKIGLVNHVYPAAEFDERIAEFLEPIANGPTVANYYSTRNIDRGLESTMQEAVERESSSQTLVLDTDDHAEGVRSFSEDRDPEFEGK